ncbi:hypothetical protein NBO_913g0001 [Nosema bombycis CQ1]|uniref:Uncharacterized protein n=1 Tax=Nosema bombycis (strain CQ1 / CVCC 102059) TaxID=578461 RepID=R0MG70_NOSB1|nr:hypothetical protein NBO_913g0001 [Nosema bombycis CQ1]|eukprot:EOB11753.1 hypothetical protein NBO_913g0001 [Nosema bombycis CQ1]
MNPQFMTFTRLRRKCIDEESSSNNVEENVENVEVEEPSGENEENVASEENEASGENETLGEQSEDISSSSEDVKKVKRSKPKLKPVIKKKVVDQDNLHVENLTVKKYSTYKLGNIKNRSMKVFTKDIDIYNMKYRKYLFGIQNALRKRSVNLLFFLLCLLSLILGFIILILLFTNI